LAPSEGVVHNNLGSVLRKLGLGEQSAAEYAMATQAAPSQPLFAFNHALALHEIGQVIVIIMYIIL
jgi:Flp pilus assembly protein TadD